MHVYNIEVVVLYIRVYIYSYMHVHTCMVVQYTVMQYVHITCMSGLQFIQYVGHKTMESHLFIDWDMWLSPRLLCRAVSVIIHIGIHTSTYYIV